MCDLISQSVIHPEGQLCVHVVDFDIKKKTQKHLIFDTSSSHVFLQQDYGLSAPLVVSIARDPVI